MERKTSVPDDSEAGQRPGHSIHLRSDPSRPTLQRALSLHHFVGIGINICIGGSIYFIGAEAFRLTGSASLVAAACVGAFSLLMGLVFAEVSSRFSATGGPYVYARSAFGRFVGFEIAWMMWYTRVLAQASLTNVALVSISFLLGTSFSPTERIAAICLLSVGIAVVHLRGIQQGAGTILVFSVLKLLPLLIVVTCGLALGTDVPALGPLPSHSDIMACILLLLFSFSGYEVIPVTAGEGKNPRRDAPLATLVSIVAMIAVWLSLQTVLITTLPNFGSEVRPVSAAAQLMGGPALELVADIGAFIAVLGTCLGTLLTASRTLFAAAADGDAPSWFAAVKPGARVPARAILFSTVVVAILAASGSFVFLAAAAAIPRLLIFIVVSAALIRFRLQDRRSGTVPASTFPIPGAPAIAMVAIALCLWALAAVSTAQLLMGLAGVIGGALMFIARSSRPRK